MASLLVNLLVSALLFVGCFTLLYKSWDRAVQPFLERAVVRLKDWSSRGQIRLPEDGVEEEHGTE